MTLNVIVFVKNPISAVDFQNIITYHKIMALIACTDKQKKDRIQASGSLERKDYYCPHEGCNAVLTLLDCDDEIKTDYFRVKPGFNHIDGCPYAKNDMMLEANGFTNTENLFLWDVLDRLIYDLNFLIEHFDSFLSGVGILFPDAIISGLNLIECDINNKKSVQATYSKLCKIRDLVKKYSVAKFTYEGVTRMGLYSIPLPFGRIKIYDSFFYSNTSFVEKCTNLLKVILKQHWYSKKWADFYFRVFAYSYEKNVKERFFKTIDACAEDFARRYNLASVLSNNEYMCAIFRHEGKDGIAYYYSYIAIGDSESIGDQVFYELYKGDVAVADIHTHGKYPNDPGVEVFSPGDLISLKKFTN